MKNEFIPYEQAVEIKELGFDKSCFAYYAGAFFGDLMIKEIPHCVISAPSFSQAFRWFREKYQLNGLLNHYPNTKKWDCSVHNLNWSGKELMEYIKTEDRVVKYSTYEEAELACLKKLIEIVKSK
jgi:hypothetical protein